MGPTAQLPASNFRPMSIAAKRSQMSATAEHFYYVVRIFHKQFGWKCLYKGNHIFFPKRLADTHNINSRNPSTPLASAQQSAVAEIGDRSATIDMGLEEAGDVVPLSKEVGG